MTTVEKIHQEFDLAQEVILAKAKEIIANTRVTNKDHVETLRQLGFTNTNVVKEADKKNRIHIKNKETADMVMRYKIEYPLLKFLTEGKLDEICEKYGLIYAPVINYKKDVPAKNLKEIKMSRALKEKDCAMPVYKVTRMAFWNRTPQSVKNWVFNAEFNEAPVGDNWFINKNPEGWSNDQFFYNMGGFDFDENTKSGLFIAAPKSHFDLRGLKKKGRGFFKTIERRVVKDPIVFRYVKGGIQVLSKWGAEAEDADLVNEKMN